MKVRYGDKFGYSALNFKEKIDFTGNFKTLIHENFKTRNVG